jgi:hypothetical protein
MGCVTSCMTLAVMHCCGDGDTSKHAAGGARSGTMSEMWGVPSQTAAL